MTPRCCLQTREPRRRCSWGPAILQCPALWSWSSPPLWTPSLGHSNSRWVLCWLNLSNRQSRCWQMWFPLMMKSKGLRCWRESFLLCCFIPLLLRPQYWGENADSNTISPEGCDLCSYRRNTYCNSTAGRETQALLFFSPPQIWLPLLSLFFLSETSRNSPACVFRRRGVIWRMDCHRLAVRLAPPGRAHGQHAPPRSLLARQHASGIGEEAAGRNTFPLCSHLFPEPDALHVVLQFAQLKSWIQSRFGQSNLKKFPPQSQLHTYIYRLLKYILSLFNSVNIHNMKVKCA